VRFGAVPLRFFLGATWAAQPYFLGSDSIYTVAWLTLALVGDGGVFVPGQRLLEDSDTPRPAAPVGCTVQYDPSQRLLVCPCHGAACDPAHAAQAVGGPAPTPLSPLRVTVTSDGTIYTA
jgi:hypothetical protein